jgi:hypothetical protein
MAEDDDPEGSTWLWARRRTRERLKGIIAALVVLPVAAAVIGVVAGPSKGASAPDHVWWAAWPFVAAFVFVASVIALWSLYRASFEQRRSLVTENAKLRAEISSLELEPVNAEHSHTIKRIFQTALTAVEQGRQIPFENDTDMKVIVGHFPELRAQIIEWDNQVDEAMIREHQLTDRFDAAMSSLSLGPPFSRQTFERFLGEAKKRAREQHLSYPYVIAWREEKTPFPELVMTREGWAVAASDETQMALTPEAIRMRAQQFVNQMMDWDQLREYGDFAKRREYERCQRELIAGLKDRAELDGYLRGSGCVRCPRA